MSQIDHRGQILRLLGHVHELAPSVLTDLAPDEDHAAPFVLRRSGVNVLYVEPGNPVQVTVLDVGGTSALVRYRRDALATLDRAIGVAETLEPAEQAQLLADLLETVGWRMRTDARGSGPTPPNSTKLTQIVRGGLPTLGKRR